MLHTCVFAHTFVYFVYALESLYAAFNTTQRCRYNTYKHDLSVSLSYLAANNSLDRGAGIQELLHIDTLRNLSVVSFYALGTKMKQIDCCSNQQIHLLAFKHMYAHIHRHTHTNTAGVCTPVREIERERERDMVLPQYLHTHLHTHCGTQTHIQSHARPHTSTRTHSHTHTRTTFCCASCRILSATCSASWTLPT